MMAPRKSFRIQTLEDLSIRAIYTSIVADLHLAHMLSKELRQSCIIAQMGLTPDSVTDTVADRMTTLPGILNDLVRDKLVKSLISSRDLDKWPNAFLDIMKIFLDESVKVIDCGSVTITKPKKFLSIVSTQSPFLTTLKINLRLLDSYGDVLDEEDQNCHLTLKFSLSTPTQESSTSFEEPEIDPMRRLTRSASKNHTSSRMLRVVMKGTTSSPLVSFFKRLQHLTTLHLTHGANNDVLSVIGQCLPQVQELKVNHSYGVSDEGLKALCLRQPAIYFVPKDNQLHNLKLKKKQLNSCCETLVTFELQGTNVSPYGIAFLLKFLPCLMSVGDWGPISDAVEILTGCESRFRNYNLVRRLRQHPKRYRITKVREDRPTCAKAVILTTIFPELKEFCLVHRFLELDFQLGLLPDFPGPIVTLDNFTDQMRMQTKLKHLTLVNIVWSSIAAAVSALASQLTALTLQSRGLDVAAIFRECLRLKYLTLDGSECQAPSEAVNNFRHTALVNLQVVKIQCHLPGEYTDVLLTNAKHLTSVDVFCLCETTDARLDQIMRCKSLQKLRDFNVSKAAFLTLNSVTLLVKSCPKLKKLGDVGGWNVSDQLIKRYRDDLRATNLDVDIVFTPKSYSYSDEYNSEYNYDSDSTNSTDFF